MKIKGENMKIKLKKYLYIKKVSLLIYWKI